MLLYKTCITCGSKFEAKRADSKFCSLTCKNKANYQRNKMKNALKTDENIRPIVEKVENRLEMEMDEPIYSKTPEVSNTSLILNEFKDIINQNDEKIKELKKLKSEKRLELNKLTDELASLSCKINKIEYHTITEINDILNMDDLSIYNTFLNTIYKSKSEKKDLFAESSLVTKIDYDGYSGEKYRQSVQGFKTNKKLKLLITEVELKSLKTKLIQAEQKSIQIKHSIRELSSDIIALERRNNKFENHLLNTISSFNDPRPNHYQKPTLKHPPTIQSNKSKSNGNLTANDILNTEYYTFNLLGEIGQFLGNIDRNRCAIALTGDSGAGKSYFSFELAELFDQSGFSVKYYSLEEGIGNLTKEKLALHHFSDHFMLTGEGNIDNIKKDAKDFDVIIIDSFGKLNAKSEDFDRLRTEFPTTIFICIFQKTTNGTMRGGASILFDSSASIDVIKRDNERIAVMQKSRYGTANWEYSISQKEIIFNDSNY